MPIAFDPDHADFSGMIQPGSVDEALRLYIGLVIHQANITVDEKGTEAAAATAVVIRATSAPGEPVTLEIDRPFIYAVRDVPTGAILFFGRVTDPS
jgi:serpin B